MTKGQGRWKQAGLRGAEGRVAKRKAFATKMAARFGKPSGGGGGKRRRDARGRFA